MSDPYGNSNYKITKQEWEKLNKLYKKVEPPAQNTLYATGDHYLLASMLMRIGFRPSSDAMEVYKMAGDILAKGWEE